MSTWLRSTTFALLLMSATPATASAQFWDIVKWINDMSGPNMTGWVYEQTVWCKYDENQETGVLWGCTPFKISAGARSTNRRSLTIGARAGRTWNTKVLNGDSDVRDISMFVIGPTVRWSPIVKRWEQSTLKARAIRAIDVSAGVELVRFYGPTVQPFWVTTIDPGLTFRPFGLLTTSHLSHIYSVGVTYKQFLETFDGRPFGAPPNSFLSETEAIWQFTLARIDLGALVFR